MKWWKITFCGCLLQKWKCYIKITISQEVQDKFFMVLFLLLCFAGRWQELEEWWRDEWPRQGGRKDELLVSLICSKSSIWKKKNWFKIFILSKERKLSQATDGFIHIVSLLITQISHLQKGSHLWNMVVLNVGLVNWK